MNSLLRNTARPLFRCFSSSPVKFCAQPPKLKPKKFIGPVTWKSMTMTALVGGGLTAFMLYVRKEKQEALDRDRKRQLGKAKIGGTFELVDSEVRNNNINCGIETESLQIFLYLYNFREKL